MHPYVHLEDEELERLTTSIAYVAGFTDASVESRTELYDLFVNGRCLEVHDQVDISSSNYQEVSKLCQSCFIRQF